MRTPLVLGNWKMHGNRAFARALAGDVCADVQGMGQVEVGLCPPFVFLTDVAAVVGESPVGLGAQNASEFRDGAYTGEISCGMLQALGCRYVLVGHSERRQLFAETPAQVIAKLVAVVDAGMIPVLCVGETLTERQSGATPHVIDAQLAPLFARADAAHYLQTAVIAYEPVWAIGTGETATPAQAQAVHAQIRQRVCALDEGLGQRMRILYGGSVKPGNAGELFGEADIDGGLIGGAALKAEDFCAIVAAAARQS